MLVLSRKYQEKIRIGDGITITVLRAKGKAVRLGIEAPADVPVIRGELAFNRPSTSEAIEGAGDDTLAAPPLPPAGRPRIAPTLSPWTTDSHPLGTDRNRGSQATPRVSLHRVPRERVAEALPQLLAGNGPLRSMLDQRSATS
jgi:carbon storage regulator CsrA